MKKYHIQMHEKAKEYYNVLGQEPEMKNMKVLFFVYAFFIISAYIMPQYFGVHIGYDITCMRLSNILIIMYMNFLIVL